MRTTLTLDDDLSDKLRQLAHKQRTSFKETVNQVLRQGLVAQQSRERQPKRFRVQTFRSAFRPGIDPVKLNQLSDEIEVAHATERAAQG